MWLICATAAKDPHVFFLGDDVSRVSRSCMDLYASNPKVLKRVEINYGVSFISAKPWQKKLLVLFILFREFDHRG